MSDFKRLFQGLDIDSDRKSRYCLLGTGSSPLESCLSALVWLCFSSITSNMVAGIIVLLLDGFLPMVENVNTWCYVNALVRLKVPTR